MFNKTVLKLAAVYNILWGMLVVIFPDQFFKWTGLEPVNYIVIWQCLGMVIGLYGLLYWWAANDPVNRRPVITIGLLGKILGPIGFVINYFSGKIPFEFIYIIIPNDLIWLVPFAIIMFDVRKKTRLS